MWQTIHVNQHTSFNKKYQFIKSFVLAIFLDFTTTKFKGWFLYYAEKISCYFVVQCPIMRIIIIDTDEVEILPQKIVKMPISLSLLMYWWRLQNLWDGWGSFVSKYKTEIHIQSWWISSMLCLMITKVLWYVSMPDILFPIRANIGPS